MKPNTQLLVLGLVGANLCSVLILPLTYLFMPHSFGLGWSFVMLFQLMALCCSYQLLKQHSFKWAELKRYLTQTQL